jgi:salicylate 5-hydroxylase large subunit
MKEQAIHWETSGTSRIPFAVYTQSDTHAKELERFFYKAHWSYVGLEAEIPNTGDFKRTSIGERSVIMTRSQDGQIHVVENVCAHRGMAFCRERHGNKKELVCPYHQWSYALDGKLQGVPFRRGVRQGGKVNGGMPADFDPKDHGLNALKVASRGGVVFASFDHEVESLEDFMGPTILQYSKFWVTTGSAFLATGSSCKRTSKTLTTPVCCTLGLSLLGCGALTIKANCAWMTTIGMRP